MITHCSGQSTMKTQQTLRAHRVSADFDKNKGKELLVPRCDNRANVAGIPG